MGFNARNVEQLWRVLDGHLRPFLKVAQREHSPGYRLQPDHSRALNESKPRRPPCPPLRSLRLRRAQEGAKRRKHNLVFAGANGLRVQCDRVIADHSHGYAGIAIP